MSRSLMTTRRFAPLFWCQFFAAFNDNLLKNALSVLILFRMGSEGGGALIALASAIFILPFFLLSALGGQFADRFDKAIVAERLKLTEIAAAGVAVVGFLLQSLPVLLLALLFFGILAAMFTPSKYGLLPDHLERSELPAGNALIEAATFLAILVGTIVGTLTAARGSSPAYFVILVLTFAVLSWLSARWIPRAEPVATDLVIDWNLFRSTAAQVRHLYAQKPLWRASLFVNWFWTVGAVVLALLSVLVKDTLGGTEAAVATYLALFAIGIAAGSGLAAWIAGGRIVVLPSPVAAIVLGLFALDLGLCTLAAVPPGVEMGPLAILTSALGQRVAFDFLGITVFGGLLIVPAFAAVQAWSIPAERARIIAGVNIVSAGWMVAGALIVMVLQTIGLGAPAIFVILAATSLLFGVAGFWFLPTNPVRDFLTIVFRLVYRIEVVGTENIAAAGANAIVALNHVSFLDGAVALSVLDRDPVFAIDEGIAKRWWVRPFLPFTRALPVNPQKPMATRSFINAVKAGETLVIFPEGRLTVTGSLMKVYDGAGMIADKTGAMVVPVRIDGLEQSAFTRLTPAQVRRRWRPKVTVTILEPVRLSLDETLKGRRRREAAGAALYEIMSELVFRTTSIDRTIFDATVEAAHKHGTGHVILEDPVSGKLTYRRMLLAARIIGRKLAPLAGVGGAVGVMLPNANGAAIAFLGLSSAGRVPAMINFTSGSANILVACRAAEIGTIVTSRAFVEKASLGPLVATLQATVAIVYLEDIRAGVGALDKLDAFLWWRRPIAERSPVDAAAILFTSGSEGVPKGVALSHRNILANAAQGAARIDFGRTDKVFNVLPLFHSFGLTVGLILPLVSGVCVYLYPSPLHYRMVPELIYGSNATILFGTDTFLAGYARSAHPYDLRSLRYIMAGAEPVKEATRRLYMEKFGLRILEGYGATETAPALALNTPMFNKSGTVGRILPGMEVRLEKVEGIESGGRLIVRGPNVMLGYLRPDKPGVIQPPEGGWHDTGDIVEIDEKGFITIKGRAKRFAKIGGEMVSLAAIEALAADVWPDAISAVTAIKDAKKGEATILLTDAPNASLEDFRALAKLRGMPELMIPAKVLVTEEMPVLGSGKVDYTALVALVESRLSPAG